MKNIDNSTLSTEAIAAGIDYWLGKSRGGYDFWKIGRLIAAADTAEFFQEFMPTSSLYRTKIALHKSVFARRSIPGLVMEFGVATGKTINRIAAAFPEDRVYGFDSFEGLPEPWRADYQKGYFARENLPQVRENVELIVGWFNETLPGFLASREGDVSFLHIDCDLYSSTMTVLDLLAERIKPGTVILFDEYFNYPGWRNHEHKAFREFTDKYMVSFDYIGAVRNNKQVAVVINKIGRE